MLKHIDQQLMDEHKLGDQVFAIDTRIPKAFFIVRLTRDKR